MGTRLAISATNSRARSRWSRLASMRMAFGSIGLVTGPFSLRARRRERRGGLLERVEEAEERGELQQVEDAVDLRHDAGHDQVAAGVAQLVDHGHQDAQ